MPATRFRNLRLGAAAFAVALLAGCGSLDNVSNSIVDTVRPYRIEVVQGNFISREQVEALQKGMTRQQVHETLGTPLVTDLFHGDRWDYVFTLKRQGVPPQQRRLTVWFKDDRLDHFEGDPMPSESEFVATLERKKPTGKIPPLEATEEQLREAAAKAGTTKEARPGTTTPAAGAVATPPANYPPLEPPAH